MIGISANRIVKDAETAVVVNGFALTLFTALYFLGGETWALFPMGYFTGGFIAWATRLWKAKFFIRSLKKMAEKGGEDV